MVQEEVSVIMSLPIIINDVLSSEDLQYCKDIAMGLKEATKKNKNKYDPIFGRYRWFNHEAFIEIEKKIRPLAIKHFNQEGVEHAWNILMVYEREKARLLPHKDSSSPCQYAFDLCIYQGEPWDIWVEGEQFIPKENDAVLFLGEEQTHWRGDFPNPENNLVIYICFFYVDKNHWSVGVKK